MAEKFYTILTNIGKASVANASALGTKVDFKFMALGDGNGEYYNPTEIQTQLVNEVYRSQINNIQLDTENANWITLSMVIPSNVGGFTVREVGVFDTDSNLIAIGKYPETYKPVIADGSSKDLTINMILEVSNTSVVNLKIDPSVILATKKYVDNLAGVGRTTETVKGNADAIVGIKNGTIEVPGLETTDKTLAGAINEVKTDLDEHKAEMTNLIKIKPNITILVTGWVDDTVISGFWKHDIVDEDITADTVVDVNIHLADLEKASDIKSANLSSAGKVTIYADDKPADNIVCDLKLIRQVSE